MFRRVFSWAWAERGAYRLAAATGDWTGSAHDSLGSGAAFTPIREKGGS